MNPESLPALPPFPILPAAPEDKAKLIYWAQDYARQAVKDERERCALICDKHSGPSTFASENSEMYSIQNRWAKVIAAAIRAQGEKGEKAHG